MLLGLTTVAGAAWANNASLKIAVAANFRTTLAQLVALYQQHHSQEIEISSASTGVLFAQISRGAPFDLFLSADAVRAQMLAKQLNNGQRTHAYALGRLALWCPAGLKHFSPVELKRFAYANPKVAPYGAAAQQALARLPFFRQAKTIKANNVAQVLSYVETGNVDCGFVALSLLLTRQNSLNWQEIPSDWYTPVEQHLLIIKPDNSIAVHFAEFLLGSKGQQAIAKAGYYPGVRDESQ
nr:molybdate ABC transporter substrate-binding protein [Echinimonas agarilytica]